MAPAQAALIARAAALVTKWPERPLRERQALLRRMLFRITVHPKRVDIAVDAHALIDILRNGHIGHPGYTIDSHDGDGGSPGGAATEATADTEAQDATVEITAVPIAASLVLTIQVHLKRAGLEMRMLVEGATGTVEPDPTLIKLILRARQLRDRMLAERLGVGELAATASYIPRIIRLGFLARTSSPRSSTAVSQSG